MKKVLDFLEQNVQWLALGLGVVYVLWMAYAYLIQKPVVVAVGNEQLPPGQVDRYIVNNGVLDLQARMEGTRVPQIGSPRWEQAFRDELGQSRTGLAFAMPMFPVDRTERINVGAREIPRGTILVEKLPSVPAAVMLESTSGRSTVVPPDQLAAAPADGGAIVQPVLDQANAQQEGIDKLWITVTYRIPMNELAAAFRSANLPLDQYRTTVLESSLYRQEQLPTGEWSQEMRIAPLPTVQLRPLPSDRAPINVKQDFLGWANANTAAILQPPFYTVIVGGDLWAPPGQNAGQVVMEEAPRQEDFDPARYVDATYDELMKLTPEQRRAVAMYKAKKEAEERANRQRGREGGGGRGPGMGVGGGKGGGPLGPNDGGRGGAAAGGEGGGYIDPGSFETPGGLMEDPRGAMEQFPGAREEGPRGPQPPNLADYPIPDGEFNPRETQDAICWAHDDTVQAGKTYRYRVVYRIKSPVWNTKNMTQPAELANEFALRSIDGEWSQPISMESLTKFFVRGQSFRGDTAQVQVFRWHSGRLQTKVFDLAPGDAVGVPDNGVDFSTGWTLVDMQSDPRTQERYVVLMDPHGKMHVRDIRSDANNPEFKQMAAEAAAAASAAGTGDAVAGSR